MKVWITKYALTSGIFTVDAEIKGGMATYRRNGMLNYVHGTGWHKYKQDAIAQAVVMCERKITALTKQIERLENLTFSAPD